ncbi:MAG: hypothetical protein WBD07_05160 [Vicinamibacterales bacterium]
MRTALIVFIVVVVIAGGATVLWLRSGPDASQFAHLREPRLTRLTDQRVLAVEAAGDPNVVGASAFKLLFSTYFSLEGVSRMGRPPAPRARWPRPQDTPKDKWLGQYALPLPDSVGMPSTVSTGALRASSTTWAYGDVAEILHVGPYNAEQPDIERLLNFISSQGYRVVGEHEEEYVKGPGMIFAGDPALYLTIIRLRVEKASGTPG